MWEAQLQEWRDGGCHGDKPKRPSASSADSRGYYKSKVLATFPNLYKAIYAYQKANPDAAQIFGEDCDWEDSVGTDNLALDDILSTSAKIRNSPLYECIDDICKGSAKMSYILQQAKGMEGKFDVRCESGSEHRYQEKITLATNIRLVKAIIYAKLFKVYGESALAYLGESSGKKEDQITRFRSYLPDENGEPTDSCWILIAGIKTVCQSIDLVECHTFIGLEPHIINAEAVQLGFRGYRINQQAGVVTVTWLLHQGSITEEDAYKTIQLKNKFAEDAMSAKLDDVVATNMVGLEELEDREV
ncbi:hypothetical protein NX059_003730 [Plenodomus lindquistii]|nr:hypothetical protein NX059_003730 [Plenodomus lindquistii]